MARALEKNEQSLMEPNRIRTLLSYSDGIWNTRGSPVIVHNGRGVRGRKFLEIAKKKCVLAAFFVLPQRLSEALLSFLKTLHLIG